MFQDLRSGQPWLHRDTEIGSWPRDSPAEVEVGAEWEEGTRERSRGAGRSLDVWRPGDCPVDRV